MVPGGGIEPPTRGFSIRCSTPELPGQSLQTIVVKAPSGAAPPESARVIACDFALASANFPFARQAAMVPRHGVVTQHFAGSLRVGEIDNSIPPKRSPAEFRGAQTQFDELTGQRRRVLRRVAKQDTRVGSNRRSLRAAE